MILNRLNTAAHHVSHAFARFGRERDGSIAILFAITITVLLVLAGLALDYGRAIALRQQMAGAIDAAALALGTSKNLTDKELQQRAQDFFAANAPGVTAKVDVNRTKDTIMVHATSDVPTTFLKVIGLDKLDVGVDNMVRRAGGKIELALVLDNTGSMASGGKIEALRDAAGGLVDTLYQADTDEENLRVGLVPFVTAVNIKAGSFSFDWIDTTSTAKHAGENFDDKKGKVNHLDLYDDMGVDWAGCVEARAAPYDLTDDAPNAGAPDTRWVPYLWPDEPDIKDGSASYPNDYLDDHTGGPVEKRQMDTKKYAKNKLKVAVTSANDNGPNKGCARPLVPLTSDKALLHDEIDAMAPHNGGGTNVAQGMAWGWRVLSPGAPFTEGSPYGQDQTQKAMIVLTDGQNEIVGNGTHNKSDYTSYGYLAVKRLGTDSVSAGITAVDNKVSTLCSRIKDKKILLYTITFKLNDGATKDLFRACATDPSMYYDSPSASDLEPIFQEIADKLSQLRLAR